MKKSYLLREKKSLSEKRKPVMSVREFRKLNEDALNSAQTLTNKLIWIITLFLLIYVVWGYR